MRLFTACTALLLSFFMTFSAAVLSQENRDDPFKRGAAYFFQKKYEMAEVLLQEALKKDPENWRIYAYLGDIFLTKKRYDAAMNMYLKTVDIAPSVAENYFRLGQVYYYKKMGDEAVRNFKLAEGLDPTMKFAAYHTGLTYLMLLRDKQNTISSWERFLQLAPEDPQYDSIKRVVELLKNPDFVIPPQGSEITIEEALLLGGAALTTAERKAADRKAGAETKKTKNTVEGLYLDDEL